MTKVDSTMTTTAILADYRLDRARDRSRKALRAFENNEITHYELREAFEEVAIHRAEVAFIQAEMAALQELYRNEF